MGKAICSEEGLDRNDSSAAIQRKLGAAASLPCLIPPGPPQPRCMPFIVLKKKKTDPVPDVAEDLLIPEHLLQEPQRQDPLHDCPAHSVAK